MGICFGKRKKTTTEIVPHNHIQPTTFVRLYGSPSSTAYIRFALKYKAAAVSLRCASMARSCDNDDHVDNDEELMKIVMEVGSSSERVSGPPKTLLHFIDARFPHPPLRLQIRTDNDETTSLVTAVVKLAELQHRSVMWHLERLGRWVVDLLTRRRKGGGVVDPTVGTARMEVRKLGKSYNQLWEVMLEHAQMEERLLFPILNFADPGICKAANEEHARDLPIMNGIKEDIKSIEVLDNGSPAYQEALSNFSKRLKSLQECYRQHFSEEERQILPYMEASELSAEQQQRLLDQCFDVMQESHSRLFNFLLEGLLPHEAMHYLDLISMCSNKERTTSMLQMII